jgi:cytochrome c oxidase subunit II
MLLASTDYVQKTDEAFWWITGISLFFLVGITLVMLYFVWRYGRKRHPKAAQIHGNMKLEITWIVIPTIIVLFMFWKGYEGFALMRRVPPNAMEIEVEARQWAWSFHYPKAGITTSELYVPVDTPVKLLLTAPIDDVIHSFYIPEFKVKEDCVPGMVNHLWFQGGAEHVKGSPYPIFCAEYCGTDHSRMYTNVHFLPKEDFVGWLQKEIAHRYRPIDLDAVMDPRSQDVVDCGAPDLYATYCVSCHGKQGQGGLVGGARSFQSLADWKLGPSVPNMFITLTEGLEGTQMRAFNNLSAWDRFALAWYVTTFYPGTDRPNGTREEFEAVVKRYGLDEQQAIPRPLDIEGTIEEMIEDAQ